jgi:hypothetical protein
MKKVKVLRSFVAVTPDGKVRASAGDIIDMPDGVDWLPAGFVELVEEEAAVAQVEEKPSTKATKKSTK